MSYIFYRKYFNIGKTFRNIIEEKSYYEENKSGYKWRILIWVYVLISKFTFIKKRMIMQLQKMQYRSWGEPNSSSAIIVHFQILLC